MLKNRTLILAKNETTYGTDATPTKTDNAILCGQPEFTVQGRKMDRQRSIQYMGKPMPVNVAEACKIKIVCELKGNGSAVDAPPEFSPLLRACNMTMDITPYTSVAFSPNSAAGIPDDADSCTIYFWQHNIKHVIVGARGTFNIDLTAGEYGTITFNMTGLFTSAVDQDIPTDATFTELIPPRFVNAAFTIDSYAAVIKTLGLDIGNQIAARYDANSATGIKEWMITNRDPKGSCDPEVMALATKDFWAMWEDTDAVALTATVGADAKNKCVITCPKVVLDVPSYAERENFLTHNLNFSLHPDEGDDEITLTFS